MRVVLANFAAIFITSGSAWSSQTVSTGTWHRLSWSLSLETSQAQELRIYLDGVQVASQGNAASGSTIDQFTINSNCASDGDDYLIVTDFRITDDIDIDIGDLRSYSPLFEATTPTYDQFAKSGGTLQSIFNTRPSNSGTGGVTAFAGGNGDRQTAHLDTVSTTIGTGATIQNIAVRTFAAKSNGPASEHYLLCYVNSTLYTSGDVGLPKPSDWANSEWHSWYIDSSTISPMPTPTELDSSEQGMQYGLSGGQEPAIRSQVTEIWYEPAESSGETIAIPADSWSSSEFSPALLQNEAYSSLNDAWSASDLESTVTHICPMPTDSWSSGEPTPIITASENAELAAESWNATDIAANINAAKLEALGLDPWAVGEFAPSSILDQNYLPAFEPWSSNEFTPSSNAQTSSALAEEPWSKADPLPQALTGATQSLGSEGWATDDLSPTTNAAEALAVAMEAWLGSDLAALANAREVIIDTFENWSSSDAASTANAGQAITANADQWVGGRKSTNHQRQFGRSIIR